MAKTICPRKPSFQTWETFVKLHRPTKVPVGFYGHDGPVDGCMFETFAQDWEHVNKQPIKNVFTVVEPDNPDSKCWYLVPGFRIVNKLGYVVVEVPWTDSAAVFRY